MPNMELEGHLDISSFRQMATVAWDASKDPTIMGFLDFNAEALERRMQDYRRKGSHVTVTHLVARALALTFQRHPHLNVVLRRRRIYQRRDVDVFVQAMIPAGEGLGKVDLSGVKIRQCDLKDASEIAAYMEERIGKVREMNDPELQKSKEVVTKIPRVFRKAAVRLVAWAQREPNWRMRWAGMPKDPFGSVMITSLGMLGVETAFAPLFPLGGPPIVILVGAIKYRPVCDEEGRVVSAKTLRLCGTFDHRVVDGFHLSKLSSTLKSLIEGETELL